jgi:hypothetical protein
MIFGYRRLLTAILPAMLALGVPAAAQNLLDNPDFDAGALSWQVQLGTLDLVADSGSCMSSQAAAGASAPTGSGFQSFVLTAEACLPVDGSVVGSLEAGGMYRTSAGVWTRIYLQFFSDADCLAHQGWSGFVAGGTSSDWTRISGPIALGTATRAVRFWIDVIPMAFEEPPFTVELDRLSLGPLPELFLDGFESEAGSACHWSSLVD